MSIIKQTQHGPETGETRATRSHPILDAVQTHLTLVINLDSSQLQTVKYAPVPFLGHSVAGGSKSKEEVTETSL